MKIENRQKTLMIFAGVCLGLFAGNFIIYEPLMKNWEARSEKIQKLRKDVEENQRLLAQKDRILDRWERMKTNALPMDKSLAESKVLNAVDSWEQASSIKIERRQPQWKEDQDYTTLELNIDASGDMTSITRFLYNLERDLPKLALRIENMDIMSRDNNGQQLSLGLQLTGLVLNPEGTPTTAK